MTDARDFREDRTLGDGTPVIFRAVRGDDKPRIREAFHHLGAETIYTRFFSSRTDVTDRELREGVDVDFVRNVTLVVTLPADETVIGAGRYIGIGDSRDAELAFTVEEDYQGLGIASRLLGILSEIGRSNGFERFHAEVLPRNTGMLRVFERCGLPMTLHRGDDTLRVTIELGPG
jgi:RimJ/RimL family protein N-acetyltransferase